MECLIVKDFLETGKELQRKLFEAYVSGPEESVEEKLERNSNKNADTFENGDQLHYFKMKFILVKL